MEKPSMLRATLIGGLVMGLVYSIPFAPCFCCLIAMGGGMLASYLYVRESPVAIRSGDGALLGILTGIVGSVVSMIISIPLTLIFGPWQARVGREAWLNILKNLPNVPPEALRQVEEMPRQAAFSVRGFIVGFIFTLVVLSIFGTLGGVIGVAVFEKRKGDEPYVAPPPPPPLPPTAQGPTNVPPPPEPPTTGS